MGAKKLLDALLIGFDLRVQGQKQPGQRLHFSAVDRQGGFILGQGPFFADQFQALLDFLGAATVMLIEELSQHTLRSSLHLPKRRPAQDEVQADGTAKIIE